jgi:hypothetical protein
MTMSNIEIEFIGRHEFRLQSSNRVYIVLHGILDARDVTALNALLRKWSAQRGQGLGLIAYLNDFEGLTAEARRLAVQMNRERMYVGCAFVGGSFMMRTIMTTLIRAGRHLAPERFKFPVFFGKTAQKCEAWLDSLQR